ncbi:MAG: zinc transporter ZntB [Micavibrio sp.]|nr:zinc transporter ZntB [Micavibrio sp.]|tara:strand:- start:4500 stop:5474 length:975 start_codon:yes stop_codon:yes gene_type:complete
MNQDYIIDAFELDGQGKGIALRGDDIARKIKEDVLAWVHFDADHPGTRQWLEQEAAYLDPIILDALMASETRPRVSEFPEGFLVILRGVNLNENAEEEDMISIRLWIDQHRIISTRKRKLRAVQTIRERLQGGNGPKNSADFLAMLLTCLIDNMEGVVLKLEDDIDEIEETLIKSPDKNNRHVINDIRHKTIILRRYISPQKEAVAQLRASNVTWLDNRHNRQLQENLDKITRYVEDLDSVRDRSQVIKDEHASILSDRMNKNLYVLSLIAALFLPLGFVTGLLGINVGGMPGVDDDMAFTIVCAICGGLLFVEYLLFRFLRWI